MNVTNRAFIKAYGLDRAEVSPPAPHLGFAPGAASDQSSAAQVDGGVTGATLNRASQHAERTAAASASRPAEPSRKSKPVAGVLAAGATGVTHFIPPPHIPLPSVQVPREQLRQHLPTRPTAAQSAAPPAPPAPAKLEPALGVPYFVWPEVCEGEIGAAVAGSPLVSFLATPLERGPHVLAVTGALRSEGRSTALLCTARACALAGLRTVMVDGDFSRPALAQQLGVTSTLGWEDVIEGRLALPEALIYSEQDRLVLLPLGETVIDHHATASSQTATITLAVLGQHYDVVLVDVGPLQDDPSSAPTLLRSANFTSALLVHDARLNTTQHLATAVARLQQMRIAVLGIAENFAGALAARETQPDSRANAA